MAVLGLDTSNYTTSSAVYNQGIITQSRMLLPVEQGKKGLRQSDAVFLHTRQLSGVIRRLHAQSDLQAIGASRSPRDSAESYMPCFLVGQAAAESFASLLGIPCYLFSHQAGHIAAAIWSAGRMDLINKRFLAFHVSGGTFEALLVEPDEKCIFRITPLADTSDLTAGQVIDRVGVMLGLSFPCGSQLEQMALSSIKTYSVHPPVKDGIVSFSGLENICGKMYNDKEQPEDIARFCFDYIAQSILVVTRHLEKQYPDLEILYAGGVMSNSIIKSILPPDKSVLALVEYASDNAAGIAILTALKEGVL